MSCNNSQIIKSDVWFLENTQEFERRKLVIGRYRGNLAVCLFETRKADGKIFSDIKHGKEAQNVVSREKTRVLYTRNDILKSKKGKPYGWTFGENKEIRNNKGEVIAIRQKRCDYFGQKEVIKEISV